MKLEGLNENATFKEKLRYVFEQIKTHGRDLHWWEDRFMVYIGRHIVNKYWERKYPKEKIVSVMEEDWDNLIILDACRYDTFVEVYGEKCDYRISKGSSTIEFLNKNFYSKKFLDTVYVTANPFVNRFASSFYKVISVWRDGWDDNLGTVLPEVMVEYALEADDKYPNKKLIIHFIQPHYPYIGDPKIVNVTYSKEHFRDLAHGKDVSDIFHYIFEKYDKNVIRKAYVKTLKLVLHYALKLSKKLQGKTVITADHGEAFGEFAFPLPIRVYGHPSELYIPVLVKVPWLVIDKGERKEIKAERESDRIKHVVKKLKIDKKL